MVGSHQASRAVAVLPLADQLAEDDSASTDVFTTATRTIVRGIAHLASSSLFQHPVGFLAARVVIAMAIRPYFRVYRGHLTLVSRALRCRPDHYHSNIHPSFSPRTSISTALRLQDIRDSHLPARYILGVKDPRVIRLQVPKPVPVAQVRVMVGAKERPRGLAYTIQANYCDTSAGITVNGMVLVSSSWAHTLFDTNASYSFISVLFASMLGLEPKLLDSTLSVGVLLGRDCELSYHCNSVRIEID